MADNPTGEPPSEPVPTRGERLAAASGFDVPGADPRLASMSVGYNLLRAAKKIERDIETNFARPAGLTFAAFRLMSALRLGGPQTPRRLADQLSVSKASVTSALDTLERSALLTRSPQPDDARMLVITLTEPGDRVVDEFLRWWSTNREKLWLDALTSGEELTLAHLLGKIAASDPEPPAEPQQRLVPRPSPPRTPGAPG
ncbi:MarR family winged helix-turn-helix transcriptional regulator [Streptomyces sp. GbtcB7]|uniref:MarR family winged helix-turn-helix transcriptional regulator n=1 Tax=Streptomyces sp. GbtcB7 TaxID=2824752 RepID=UPI001C2F1AB3|nr:MarR family winged helix-turn-helix transcriptional regulator [Streptomyces sp. GbtcB7]